MSDAIVTICSPNYSPLLNLWISALKPLTSIPLYVLTTHNFVPTTQSGVSVISVDPSGNPFPSTTPDHVCAEKLRLFKHLPQEVTRILFLDVDIWVLRPFWHFDGGFDGSRDVLSMCPDLFVGYKEKMNNEFQPFDPSFQMRYNSDGTYHYFNTGAFFASRDAHASLFSKFLETWDDYITRMPSYPSIFDQNVINYCLIKYGVEVQPMSLHNNCLCDYEPEIRRDGSLMLNGQPVNAYHFNGDDAQTKYSRWLNMEANLHRSYVRRIRTSGI